MMKWNAKWVTVPAGLGDVAPLFSTRFPLERPVRQATLAITAVGVYDACLNGERVGEFILVPAWTYYPKRLQ